MSQSSFTKSSVANAHLAELNSVKSNLLKGNAREVLESIKMHGAQTSQQLASQLKLTSMGARKHLLSLEGEGLVSSYSVSEGKGRPKQKWQLTAEGHHCFPQRHAQLTVNLIESVKEVFGDDGLHQLIKRREKEMAQGYLETVAVAGSLGEALGRLATMRTQEGYMATVQQDGDDWLLIEHHCPICAAAKACQGFCRSELSLFQRCLMSWGEVARDKWLIEGDERCVYRVSPR